MSALEQVVNGLSYKLIFMFILILIISLFYFSIDRIVLNLDKIKHRYFNKHFTNTEFKVISKRSYMDGSIRVFCIIVKSKSYRLGEEKSLYNITFSQYADFHVGDIVKIKYVDSKPKITFVRTNNSILSGEIIEKKVVKNQNVLLVKYEDTHYFVPVSDSLFKKKTINDALTFVLTPIGVRAYKDGLI